MTYVDARRHDGVEGSRDSVVVRLVRPRSLLTSLMGVRQADSWQQIGKLESTETRCNGRRLPDFTHRRNALNELIAKDIREDFAGPTGPLALLFVVQPSDGQDRSADARRMSRDASAARACAMAMTYSDVSDPIPVRGVVCPRPNQFSDGWGTHRPAHGTPPVPRGAIAPD